MGDIAYEINKESPRSIWPSAGLRKRHLPLAPFSSGAEAEIIETLRAAGDLTLSLVATRQSKLLGHCAFSPVEISDAFGKWYALGPISVWPEEQQKGIGRALVMEGLQCLKIQGAQGCVVIGNPRIYSRLGFHSDGQLMSGTLDRALVQRIIFKGSPPVGSVSFAPAFEE